MKALLMILVYSGLLSLTMSTTRPGQKKNNTKNITHTPDSIAFKKEVMPLLQSKCSPCHFEGGKMYERMPFDKATTLSTHAAGILRRLNDANDKQLVEKYIKEHQSAQ